MRNTQDKINKTIDSIRKTLLEKNKRYGNAALEPIGVFCKLPHHQGILQRIDDKLMRIKNTDTPSKNDVFDLIGYLTLYSVARDWEFEDLID